MKHFARMQKTSNNRKAITQQKAGREQILFQPSAFICAAYSASSRPYTLIS